MATSVVHDNDYVPPVAKPPTKIVTSDSQALTIISCVIGVFTLGVAAWVYQHIQKKKLKDPVEIETDFGNPQGTARAVDFADVDFDFGGDVAQEAPAAAAVSRNDFEFDFGSNPVNSAGGGAGEEWGARRRESRASLGRGGVRVVWGGWGWSVG